MAPTPFESDEPRQEPWQALAPGDLFSVRSHVGRLYRVRFLASAAEGSCLYVRLEDGTLARLNADRVEWRTLDKVERGDACVVGDEVIFSSGGGVELRGKLLEPIMDTVSISSAGGKVSLALARIDAPTFRLLFHVKKVEPGDEFLVESFSRNTYRGRAVRVDKEKIVARLARDPKQVRVHLNHLALETLRLLVPVPLSLLGCSPV